jgi:hypothetical protein
MRELHYHYKVELHNFAPNAISQATTFITVCEGFMRVHASWDLWFHLFQGELHTVSSGVRGTCQPIHAGGLMFALHDRGKDLNLQCTMMSNNTG